MNPSKLQHLTKEVEYMLRNGIIEPSLSEWSSPCVLVPKPDGSYHFCTDFRRLNAVTVTNSYPIPRIDDCIDCLQGVVSPTLTSCCMTVVLPGVSGNNTLNSSNSATNSFLSFKASDSVSYPSWIEHRNL